MSNNTPRCTVPQIQSSCRGTVPKDVIYSVCLRRGQGEKRIGDVDSAPNDQMSKRPKCDQGKRAVGNVDAGGDDQVSTRPTYDSHAPSTSLEGLSGIEALHGIGAVASASHCQCVNDKYRLSHSQYT